MAAVVAAAVLIGLLAVRPLQVCRDWAFVCENTGSHQGYRQWFTGRRTRQWYNESRLEQFVRQQHATELTHAWNSYVGSGRNIFGQTILFGHGRPNLVLQVRRPAFDRYVESLDDAGKLSLYRTLASGQQNEIEVHMRKVRKAKLARAKPGLPPG